MLKMTVTQIKPKDWFITIDLKDAYFPISILPQHRKYLRFALMCEAYQYQVQVRPNQFQRLLGHMTAVSAIW